MFWSPDSRFVAFDAFGQLKKVDVTGGSPQTVCTLPSLAIGGSWNQDDVIVVGSPAGGLVRCPASGGAASIVTQPGCLATAVGASLSVVPPRRPAVPLSERVQSRARELRHLPALARRAARDDLVASHSRNGLRRGLRCRTASAKPGHLLFMRDGALFAQAFDPARLQLTGEAARIAEPVGSFLDGAFFSASRNGSACLQSSRRDVPADMAGPPRERAQSCR